MRERDHGEHGDTLLGERIEAGACGRPRGDDVVDEYDTSATKGLSYAKRVESVRSARFAPEPSLLCRSATALEQQRLEARSHLPRERSSQ